MPFHENAEFSTGPNRTEKTSLTAGSRCAYGHVAKPRLACESYGSRTSSVLTAHRTRGRVRDGCPSDEYLRGMASGASMPAYSRVTERRRAVTVAQHFREAEGLSIMQIAERLGRAP